MAHKPRIVSYEPVFDVIRHKLSKWRASCTGGLVVQIY
jgi:hypothetical protein